MKGTGRWTIQEAAERNCPATVMATRRRRGPLGWRCPLCAPPPSHPQSPSRLPAAALDARYISARKDERVVAEGILKGPTETHVPDQPRVSPYPQGNAILG